MPVGPGRELLTGAVEVDETIITGFRAGGPGNQILPRSRNRNSPGMSAG